MNEQAIFTLCEKLGTTIDKLVPKVIEFGVYNSTRGLIFGISLLFIAIICFIILHKIQDDMSWAWIICVLIGLIGIIFGVGMTAFNLWDLHLWHHSPEMMAYKTLLNWLN